MVKYTMVKFSSDSQSPWNGIEMYSTQSHLSETDKSWKSFDIKYTLKWPDLWGMFLENINPLMSHDKVTGHLQDVQTTLAAFTQVWVHSTTNKKKLEFKGEWTKGKEKTASTQHSDLFNTPIIFWNNHIHCFLLFNITFVMSNCNFQNEFFTFLHAFQGQGEWAPLLGHSKSF